MSVRYAAQNECVTFVEYKEKFIIGVENANRRFGGLGKMGERGKKKGTVQLYPRSETFLD